MEDLFNIINIFLYSYTSDQKVLNNRISNVCECNEIGILPKGSLH